MTSSKDFFQTIDHAELYKKYRRDAPMKCIEKTINFLAEKVDPSKCNAIDVGCGSGQATLPLAPFVKHILGVDTSVNQLEHAKKDPRASSNKNVEFKVSGAETLPLDDGSVHLVFAMDAAHWFNFELFQKEADRVLAPNGVLALCTSSKPLILVGHEEEEQQVYKELIEASRGDWNKTAIDWTKFYDNLELPYKRYIRDYSTEEEYEISVADQIGSWRTHSGIHNFIAHNPEKGELLMKATADKLMKIMKSESSPEDTMLTYRKPFILLLARKPAN